VKFVGQKSLQSSASFQQITHKIYESRSHSLKCPKTH